ncbi:MAG TPA: hypothetical protein VM598_03640 [Bdellovibrionota bacterium]|nr:hypothetical protein [Bdellovibrionota bacterium]
MALDTENYSRGFLVDEELMAGVTENPDRSGGFAAFVLRHETGEYLGYRVFPTLDAALAEINAIPRQWAFEKVGGCSAGGCKGGNCGKSGGACPRKTACETC